MTNNNPRIYLSGPMTGIDNYNFPAFNRAAEKLRSCGYDVINPAELCPNQTATWAECMRLDIKALCDCDTIALMPGWEKSSGAQLELHIAHRIGLDVVFIGHEGYFTNPQKQPKTEGAPNGAWY